MIGDAIDNRTQEQCAKKKTPEAFCFLSSGQGPRSNNQRNQQQTGEAAQLIKALLPILAPEQTQPEKRIKQQQQMNQAVFAFRRYEDASLRYTGIESHEGLMYYGLYDTVVAKDANEWIG